MVSFGAHGSRSFRERLKLQLPPRRRLADALLATAQELQQRGEWSLAVDYVRVAREIQPLQPDSRSTARKAAALPVDPTGVAGWRRFNAPEPALSTAAEQVLVFFLQPTPSVGPTSRGAAASLPAAACGGRDLRESACSALADAQHGDANPHGAVELGERTFESLGVPRCSLGRKRDCTKGCPGSQLRSRARSGQWRGRSKDPNHARYFFFHATLCCSGSTW